MTDDTIAIWLSYLNSPGTPKTAMSPIELDGYLTGIIVTPQSAPILPRTWIALLWGIYEPVFEDDAQIKAALGAAIKHHNALVAEIDRSLIRLEADEIVDYRPLFQPDGQKPTHDIVRTWVRGFAKAMALAPKTWSALVEDERTNIIIQPFVGFFNLDGREPDDIPANIDDLLDEDAASIPRMILVLRKLAQIRQEKSDPAQRPRQKKIGRNDACPCGSGKKFKHCCGRTSPVKTH